VYSIDDKPMRNFMEVSSIHTGDSIRLSLKEGWRPEFSTDESGMEIKLPKKIAVPALVLYFLLNSIRYSIELSNEILDNQIKRLDVEIKKIELYQKLAQSKSIKSSERTIKLQSNKIIKYFVVTHSTQVRSIRRLG
jgi:uroporphyrinogen-III synthase